MCFQYHIILNQEVIDLETYKASGRHPYNCNMNDQCNQNRPMSSYGRPMSMNSRPMNNQHNHQLKPHQCMDIMPIAKDNDCDCKDNNHHMRHMTLGMGYVPMQEWSDLYDLETAICQGTIFPELNLIFCGARGKM